MTNDKPLHVWDGAVHQPDGSYLDYWKNRDTSESAPAPDAETQALYTAEQRRYEAQMQARNCASHTRFDAGKHEVTDVRQAEDGYEI